MPGRSAVPLPVFGNFHSSRVFRFTLLPALPPITVGAVAEYNDKFVRAEPAYSQKTAVSTSEGAVAPGPVFFRVIVNFPGLRLSSKRTDAPKAFVVPFDAGLVPVPEKLMDAAFAWDIGPAITTANDDKPQVI
nr:hypothetical protein [Nostoc sp. FACHB-152]